MSLSLSSKTIAAMERTLTEVDGKKFGRGSVERKLSNEALAVLDGQHPTIRIVLRTRASSLQTPEKEAEIVKWIVGRFLQLMHGRETYLPPDIKMSVTNASLRPIDVRMVEARYLAGSLAKEGTSNLKLRIEFWDTMTERVYLVKFRDAALVNQDLVEEPYADYDRSRNKRSCAIM